jgi:methionyl-tRNA formyltransferase
MINTVLVLGNDEISCDTLEQIRLTEDILLLIDKSSNFKRVLNLLRKKKLTMILIFKMLVCKCIRYRSCKVLSKYKSVSNNNELLEVLSTVNPARVILFRAGLIISSDVINLRIPLMNIHCARIPEYGGLGAIDRALQDKEVEQTATLHKVTETIDSGEIFDVEPFTLDVKRSYCYNEDQAYKAGQRLLLRALENKYLRTNS